MSVITVSGITNTKHHQAVRPQRGVADRIEDKRIPMFLDWTRPSRDCPVKRRLWDCGACGHQTSATAGTVLHRSHLPLTTWFAAAFLMSSHTPGISALQLQRFLGLSGYKSA